LPMNGNAKDVITSLANEMSFRTSNEPAKSQESADQPEPIISYFIDDVPDTLPELEQLIKTDYPKYAGKNVVIEAIDFEGNKIKMVSDQTVVTMKSQMLEFRNIMFCVQ